MSSLQKYTIKLMFKINEGGKEDSVFNNAHLGGKLFLFTAAFQIMWIIFQLYVSEAQG